MANPARIKLGDSEVLRALVGAMGFFFVLAGYYVLRPLRDELGIQGGVENLDWMFSATFAVTCLCMLAYARLSASVPRFLIVFALYLFVALSLVLMRVLYFSDSAVFARIMFVWISVINLFLVSGFWAVMIDGFDHDAAQRQFGRVAAGGTLGALAGPALASLVARALSPSDMLLIASACLFVAAILLFAFFPHARRRKDEFVAPSTFAGFDRLFHDKRLLCLSSLVLFYSLVGTFVYLLQAQIVEANIQDSTRRVQLFADINLTVNSLTLAIQVLLTPWLLRRFGLAWCLALLPAIALVGMLALSLWSTLAVVVALTVALRTTRFAIQRPTREVLFGWLPIDDRYRSRTAMDTLIYRASDVVGAWSVSAIQALGAGIAGVAGVGALLAMLWWSASRYSVTLIRPTQPKEAKLHEPG